MAATAPIRGEFDGNEGPQVPLRVNPNAAEVGNVQAIKHLAPDVQARKLVEIKRGAGLLAEYPPFPDSRKCQDAFWALLFIVTIGGTLALAFTYSKSALAMKPVADKVNTEHPLGSKDVWTLLSPGLAGTAAALVSTNMFLLLARCAPTCVVYSSLLLSPVLMIVQGLAFMAFFSNNAVTVILGAAMVFVGVCSLSCVLCCWNQYIPFTSAVVQMIADIADDHPCMIVVSVCGSFLAAGLALASCLAIAGIQEEASKDAASTGTEVNGLIMVMALFAAIWGTGVIYNTCHCVYCGIFGRWYFGKPGHMVLPSLWVALTTSFGSICFGSFLVGVVNLMTILVQGARRDAQQEGNIICCILLLCVECALSCIGDILEYFNDWAYVQCAIRGASYCQAARITNSLATCANVQFIFRDMLIGTVTVFGAIFCMLVGGGVGAAVGYAMGFPGERAWMAGVGAAVGLVGGFFAGTSAMSIFPSGSKTLLSCWAEDPEPLQESHPEVHALFCERVHRGCYGSE